MPVYVLLWEKEAINPGLVTGEDPYEDGYFYLLLLPLSLSRTMMTILPPVICKRVVWYI